MEKHMRLQYVFSLKKSSLAMEIWPCVVADFTNGTESNGNNVPIAHFKAFGATEVIYLTNILHAKVFKYLLLLYIFCGNIGWAIAGLTCMQFGMKLADSTHVYVSVCMFCTCIS